MKLWLKIVLILALGTVIVAFNVVEHLQIYLDNRETDVLTISAEWNKSTAAYYGHVKKPMNKVEVSKPWELKTVLKLTAENFQQIRMRFFYKDNGTFKKAVFYPPFEVCKVYREGMKTSPFLRYLFGYLKTVYPHPVSCPLIGHFNFTNMTYDKQLSILNQGIYRNNVTLNNERGLFLKICHEYQVVEEKEIRLRKNKGRK